MQIRHNDMDEPFLSRRILDGDSTPRFKTKLSSSYNDQDTPRRQSIPKLLENDYVFPLLTTLRANSFKDPFLSRTVLEGANTPRSKTRFSSTYLDHDTPRIQSAAKLLNNDVVLPLITTPRTNSIADLIIKFHRSASAPALFTEETGIIQRDFLNSKHRCRPTTPKIIRIALLGFLLYIITGITVYLFTNEMFTGHKTDKLIDALYFTVVTLCTIGYGDIVPATTFSKLFTCVFILVGFGFIDILLHGLVTYVLDNQEEVLLGAVDQNRFNKMVRTYLVDKEKGRMRIRIKICLAMGVVVLCLAIGTITMHYIEKLNWVDSFYLSVTSVTTVGYGDYAFKTVKGRCFAIIWLLASTLAVARAFLYLTEYRIERRNHRMAREVLQRKLTLGDLVAADMDRDGSISKAEYVIFKLKEMGKIAEKDVLQICKQFDSLESTYNGKITVSDLMKDNTNEALNL